MNLPETIRFLEENQPLPPDSEFGQRSVAFDEARRFFQPTLNVPGLRLPLGAFGDGDGFGIYQVVEATALAHVPTQVVPILKQYVAAGVNLGVTYRF